MSPTVSVVVATYRRDEALKNALESLGKQSFTDLEIVVVDDNSNEEWNAKVKAIIENFQQTYPSVDLKYIPNASNQGSAKTRNIGIDAALGEYITFLDDDDLYLPEKVKRQVEFMIEGGYDFSITDLDLYNENDKLIDQRIRSYIKSTDHASLLEYHLKYHMTGTDTMMFRKDYLVKIGKFAPIDVGDEFYLMQRAIDGEGKFGYLSGSDIKAYVHTGEGGLSSGDGKIKGENALFEYKKNYFDKLSPKDRRYIKVRHYAVIAFAEVRRKRYFAFIGNAFKAFFCSPVVCVRMLVSR